MAIHDQGTAYRTRTGVEARYDAGLRSYMLSVYNYMASGLALSGIMAVLVAYTPALRDLFFIVMNGRLVGITPPGMVLVFAPLGMILLANFMVNRWSVSATQIFYWLFVAVDGAGLAILLLRYTTESAVLAFFLTAAAFAGLSIYGYTTKRDLSGLGKFLFMAIWGLVLVSIAYMIMAWVLGWGSSFFVAALSFVSILLFGGIVAWKTQDMRFEYYEAQGTAYLNKIAVWSALTLYIAFVAILQNLMQLIGQDR
ncbi:Bax inhibitor-1/YccA family protein [Phaeovibrio sulfidiphilus]|uniref:Bax inhibitor-1/YccA family protein n=1 Tax=Phaeovibrio sulfidiphilus TaxID=1220600 RepID=A0A8J6YP87_9PROT|nr:Bax inhibitor-1/YccA family protein [Phaeovibrio sulfidiphilus]MBE1237464.1 Bax inhibitor-1/YccA family protein [Phaeovibrio sulfidiphilus]